MLPMTLAGIAEVVRGRTHQVPDPEAVVTGAAFIDSRRPVVGGLFVAFDGETVDGHDFASQAVAAGAAAVLASREVAAPAIVVPDVLEALNVLTSWTARQMTGTRRIGVTGSSGKTSTKDLMAQVLGGLGATVATVGSQNNEIGVPLTVLGTPPGTKYLVLEMGARGIGHLAHLTDLVPLDVAVVLNVGSAHAGEFGGREATAQAKGELVEALSSEGVAVLNADDLLVSAMASRSKAPVTFFGRGAGADVRAEDVRLDDHGRARFELHTPGGHAPVELRVLGEHHVSNALAVAAVAYRLGMTTEGIAETLSGAVATTGSRMQLHERADGVTVIDDAYNANPDSMAAALRALAAMGTRRRTVAVIGEMRELGPDSAADHRAIGELAGGLGVDVVVGVGGDEAGVVVAGAAEKGAAVHHVADRTAAAELLGGLLTSGDLVLVKANLGAGLQALVRDLVNA
ncbi:UDP-N-acetylmuramoyl-tripeptide--D-alanyl-D-alanine ligase [Streptomyces sp. SL13]|uniref:UDP-N-acetylmuramoyl-tripeptide--D-alanyl-D-alanine ligase n=1 Tax=Streptantibioticus silvisoli TaxID=2705255 RepID=A0AA90H3A7_9ACTN|nr:UDP-N-acetylmuramoyl-tripeptide--D-alanyl-D-alanine ligase [Streptantibioticus silvisoli]MDI5969925.1 UDP-N-acetylmuramoyl-tripeptide--D-alanyl-D-alanine ligase [Streptantibioticus silvisoli]